MKIHLNYKRNPHQELLHDDITTKFLHLSSGFGGGKSYALIMKAFQLSWLNRGCHGGFVCPTFTDYKKDIYPLMEQIIYESGIKNVQQNKSEHWWKFPWTKGKLYIASAEKKLRGPNWGYACINEATLIPQERYREVIGRVRVKKAKNPQIVSVGTPEGTAHWLYDAFIEEPMRNSRVIYGDTRDNLENLSDDYVQSLEDSYDSTMLDAYLKGLWVNMSNNRFYYAYDPKKNDNKDIKQIPYATVHASLDFNVDKMCCTLWHYDGIKCRAFDSIILKGNADTKKMCDALKARGYWPDLTILYPDPAGNARSTKGRPDNVILKEEGFYQVRVKTTQPRMRQRQLHMNNLLGKGIIEINPETCKDLKKDFESVEQNVITLDKNKKNAELTHSSDGADYMFDILIPFVKPTHRSGMMKIR